MAARLWSWVDSRMPSLKEEWRKHAAEYYAPKNFNFWYFFGSLALLVLVIQIVSGIFLTMNYKPDANLNRFFALHVIAFPLVLLGLVVVHILALHDVGSNNPDGVDIKKYKDAHGRPLDGIPFHPYYTVKDLMGAVAFLGIFCFVIF